MTLQRFAVPYRVRRGRTPQGIVVVASPDVLQAMYDAADMVQGLFVHTEAFHLMTPCPIGDAGWGAILDIVTAARPTKPEFAFQSHKLRPRAKPARKATTAKPG